MTIMKFLGFIVGFTAFLYVIFVATKLIASKTNKAMKGKNMSVIETLSLGIDKQLFLVKVGEKYLLMAGAGKSIEFVCDVEIDLAGSEVSQNENELFDFKNIFDKYIINFASKKKSKENVKNENVKEEKDKITDDERFKSNLMKLKTINVKGGIHGGRD